RFASRGENGDPEPLKPLAPNADAGTLVFSPDRTLQKPGPAKPPEVPNTPAKKPEERKPEKPKAEPKLDTIIAKRRQRLDDEELRKQLAKVPELRIDAVVWTSDSLVKEAVRLKEVGQH